MSALNLIGEHMPFSADGFLHTELSHISVCRRLNLLTILLS
jgi:hypothetical protein